MPRLEKRPVNILMVDDQPAKLLSYETILSELGENLIRANSGKEALEHLLSKEIAVVLVDVVMPELDGFELASMIRNHPRFQRTSIILVSGVMVEDADRLKGYGSGAMDYVSVPIIPEILRAKVRVFADLYRKTDELERLNRDLEARVAERTSEIEAALKRVELARQEAETANRMKDEFLATLSHELRTPLNAITGWAYILLAGKLSEEERVKAIETIRRNALLQSKLISDLLDVSRIITGKLQLNWSEVDLSAVIDAAVESLRPIAAAKSVRIDTDLSGYEPRSFFGDAARLQQVLGNLLANAIKFGPVGGRVQLAMTSRKGGVEITVQDEGPGIKPETLPYIFDRFRQGDSSSTRAHHGLGLGLAITRHLLDLHDGTVQAANRTDRSGSIFTIVLPAREQQSESPEESAPEHAMAEQAARVAARPSLSGMRILVVDDDPDGREVLSVMLQRCGAEILLASSAAEAFEMLKRERPDVMLVDIEMPGEDGYSLILRVRALSPEEGALVPAAAVTAYASAQDRAKALSAGFQLHLSKPVDITDLPRAVGSLARTTVPSAVREKPRTAESLSPKSPLSG
jgi:signal transduction histidine kinase